MPSRIEAIETLEARGELAAAEHVRKWQNKEGKASGWDASLRRHYPQVIPLLWPQVAPATDLAPPGAQLADGRVVPGVGPVGAEAPTVEPAAAAQELFDAYLMVATGADSVWWALVSSINGAGTVSSGNCATRSELTQFVRAQLNGPLKGRRVLVGFDFPFGYPGGFAAALGHQDPATAWRAAWDHLAKTITDDDRNVNNRFRVAADLNLAISGGFGPFFGRPVAVANGVARSLSPNQKGYFTYPVASTKQIALGKERETDRVCGVTSSPWFLYGGGNSVGSQALVGIPRVAQLRREFPDSLVWPFETDARVPARAEARVVFAEIYPSLFHQRLEDSAGVHDEEQVIATATAFARCDAEGALEGLFARPTPSERVLREEGWILGA